VSFIDFPENIAEMEVEGKVPLKVQSPAPPVGAPAKIKEAAEMIAAAKHPLILAGNGVVRAGASAQLIALAEHLKLPVATTFMGKGVIPSSHPLCLGTIGLQSRDYVNCGFDRADVIICVGYDLIEYHPHPWNPEKDRQIINISRQPAEVDEHYIIAIGVIGEIGSTLDGIAALLPPREESASGNLHRAIVEEVRGYAEDSSFPMKPAKIVWDLRQVLSPECIVINDVGAHKMWMARMYQAERPNTCIISNGFAAMGISLPGAVAAKLAFPQRTVVAVTGDAGFLMNSQEIETALRIGTPIVILIWNDSGYGLIKWHQLRRFGHSSNVDFSNPDFVKYAESFGAKGYRVGAADELAPVLQQAIADDTVVIIDCPVDYSENMKLTERLGKLVCPI